MVHALPQEPARERKGHRHVRKRLTRWWIYREGGNGDVDVGWGDEDPQFDVGGVFMIWNDGSGMWNVFMGEIIRWIHWLDEDTRMAMALFVTLSRLWLHLLSLIHLFARMKPDDWRFFAFRCNLLRACAFRIPNGGNVLNTSGSRLFVWSSWYCAHWFENALARNCLFVSIWPQMTCAQHMPCTIACCWRSCNIKGKGRTGSLYWSWWWRSMQTERLNWPFSYPHLECNNQG